MSATSVSPVHLMWTGGWDSTFQLLRLLLVHRVPVRPVYVIDEDRHSLDIELRTMDRIRERLGELHPETRALMLPTLTGRKSALRPDPVIEEAFARLLRLCPLGSQYEWLAKFCREHDLHEVEVGFEKTRSGAGALLTDLGVPGTSAAGYPVHRIAPNGEHADARTVFGFYACPLFEITKQEMASEVDARGWRPIMLETWFCHRPVQLEPCGRCNPCLGVIRSGLGWRVPARRRVLGTLYRLTIGQARSTAKRLLAWPRRASVPEAPAG